MHTEDLRCHYNNSNVTILGNYFTMACAASRALNASLAPGVVTQVHVGRFTNSGSRPRACTHEHTQPQQQSDEELPQGSLDARYHFQDVVVLLGHVYEELV